jgi:hypothetical protein
MQILLDDFVKGYLYSNANMMIVGLPILSDRKALIV